MSYFLESPNPDSYKLEYHNHVLRPLSASVVLLGLISTVGLFQARSQAQINGVPASVTSPGFGGRSINGTPSSVTSLGPRGFTPNAGVPFFPNAPRHDRDRDRDRHRRSQDFFPYYGGVYAVPAVIPYSPDTQDYADDDDPNYQGGPTVFDRRGPGAEAYVPPVANPRPAHPAQSASSDAPPEPPQPPTLLVFKDGHQLEVGNYAIVGQTLFDLTPGHPRRIALSDLDLDATQKLNEDRGVSFQLPPTAQGS
jgi:hypothetical protein